MGATERVLDEVDGLQDEMVTGLGDLVRIPSVGGTPAENEAQAHLAARFTGLDVDHWQVDLAAVQAAPDFPGAEVAREEAWGLVGRLPGSGDGASLMLNAHIDVVPAGERATWGEDPFSGVVVGDRLLGRGACDMKGGLVSALWAVQAVRRSGVRLRGDLLLASVQGEEDGGLGTFALLQRGWRADACVIPEPTGLDVVPAHSGALTFRLRVHGLASHAAMRTEGVSAVDKLVPVLTALQDLERRRHADVDPLMSRWDLAHPLSIGSVRSGVWASSVPDLLVAEGRMGVALGEPVESARQQLEDAVAEAGESDPWLKEHPVEVEWWGGQFASGQLPEGSDLVARIQRAHGGDPREVYGVTYGSDLRLLTGLGGIPTAMYGPGAPEHAHVANESISLPEVRTAARTLALLALDVCGVA